MVNTLRVLLADKSSDSRAIEVLIAPNDPDLIRCDLVYVANSSSKSIANVLQRLSAHSVLTIGDAASFAKQGGMVALVTVGERVEIQVNLEATKREKLKVSSRLLNLARVVHSGTDAGN